MYDFQSTEVFKSDSFYFYILFSFSRNIFSILSLVIRRRVIYTRSRWKNKKENTPPPKKKKQITKKAENPNIM